jgi:hypothetical protein
MRYSHKTRSPLVKGIKIGLQPRAAPTKGLVFRHFARALARVARTQEQHKKHSKKLLHCNSLCLEHKFSNILKLCQLSDVLSLTTQDFFSIFVQVFLKGGYHGTEKRNESQGYCKSDKSGKGW